MAVFGHIGQIGRFGHFGRICIIDIPLVFSPTPNGFHVRSWYFPCQFLMISPTVPYPIHVSSLCAAGECLRSAW